MGCEIEPLHFWPGKAENRIRRMVQTFSSWGEAAVPEQLSCCCLRQALSAGNNHSRRWLHVQKSTMVARIEIMVGAL